MKKNSKKKQNEEFNYMLIDLDKDIEYAGNTEREKELNKELLNTTLELNAYQDSYDKMKTVDEIKERIEELQKIVDEKETNFNFVKRREAEVEIRTLNWVLNGSITAEEKEDMMPKANPEEVQRILEDFEENKNKKKNEDVL